MVSYEVEQYSRTKLGEILDRYSHKRQGYSKAKSHLYYFGEYFKFVGARTIIIEDSYTDRDYLEDYAAYYARCHDDYIKRCARLHFFDTKFDTKLIDRVVSGDNAAVKELQSSYLGFIVVKPLPSTVIGRTCLVTYGNKDRDRSFPPTREYEVHLLGIELRVTSLAFQEQDTDVAACATSALWSMFHATGLLFQHHIPTPAEITKAATASQRPVTRTLPASNGLNAGQIADAIRSVGLEPLEIGAQNLDILRISACAYLRAGIPCVLLGNVVEGNPKVRNLGLHAITIVGYSTPTGVPQPFGPSDTLFTSTTTERLYAHDDQVGPFARLRFDGAIPATVGTSWRDDNKKIGNMFFEPFILLVPLYHKIRVPVKSIIKTLVALDDWIETARGAKIVQLTNRIEWGLFLTDNAKLKADIYQDKNIAPDFRLKALYEDMPHYIWRATATSGGSKLFDLLFDATDLLQGGHIIGGLPYSGPACTAIAAVAKNPRVADYVRNTGNRGLEMATKWFAEHSGQF